MVPIMTNFLNFLLSNPKEYYLFAFSNILYLKLFGFFIFNSNREFKLSIIWGLEWFILSNIKGILFSKASKRAPLFQSINEDKFLLFFFSLFILGL